MIATSKLSFLFFFFNSHKQQQHRIRQKKIFGCSFYPYFVMLRRYRPLFVHVFLNAFNTHTTTV